MAAANMIQNDSCEMELKAKLGKFSPLCKAIVIISAKYYECICVVVWNIVPRRISTNWEEIIRFQFD